jgi:hypothetical protein
MNEPTYTWEGNEVYQRCIIGRDMLTLTVENGCRVQRIWRNNIKTFQYVWVLSDWNIDALKHSLIGRYIHKMDL